ncbi:hypothetical protein DPMN_021478 [Dreissena polymorpha]|uniref:Uncharacterized protein n=1 Tax=Dreissena polymorpha TaxID=45954 RepID=A0A9D4NM41_DREPO|nr:hypothetical protein DPMN_021478 [Dreissena polymorpha]
MFDKNRRELQDPGASMHLRNPEASTHLRSPVASTPLYNQGTSTHTCESDSQQARTGGF